MPESTSHRRAKRKAAGKSGQTEVLQRGGTRLDAQSKTTATEIERSGSPQLLRKAAQRLKKSSKPKKVLRVPQPDMGKASEAMKSERVPGTVSNLGGTKRRRVR